MLRTFCGYHPECLGKDATSRMMMIMVVDALFIFGCGFRPAHINSALGKLGTNLRTNETLKMHVRQPARTRTVGGKLRTYAIGAIADRRKGIKPHINTCSFPPCVDDWRRVYGFKFTTVGKQFWSSGIYTYNKDKYNRLPKVR